MQEDAKKVQDDKPRFAHFLHANQFDEIILNHEVSDDRIKEINAQLHTAKIELQVLSESLNKATGHPLVMLGGVKLCQKVYICLPRQPVQIFERLCKSVTRHPAQLMGIKSRKSHLSRLWVGTLVHHHGSVIARLNVTNQSFWQEREHAEVQGMSSQGRKSSRPELSYAQAKHLSLPCVQQV